MYTPFRKLILASGLALTIVAINSAASADTSSQDVTDARQETQISTTYALSPYLRAHDISVSVQDGKATLTGNVEESINKDLAKQIALGVKGITEVDNQIVVEADYIQHKPSAERSYGEIIDDATITAAVKSKLLWSKYADGLTTDVDTQRGKVKLQGTADSKEARELAGLLAMNTHGVVKVDNQLVVKDSKPGVAVTLQPAAKQDNGRITDAWITTKVKSTYLYTRNINSSEISVTTSNGIVSLSGKVNGGVDRALAIELANNVRGVTSVESKDLTLL